MIGLKRMSSVKLDAGVSQLFDEVSFYPSFSKDVKRAKKSILVESPFMTVKRTREFIAITQRIMRNGATVRINTRHPIHHEGVLISQAWSSIKLLRDAGIKVYLYKDMRHRKISIIDSQVLWEGSLNMLSHNRSRELMRRTESVAACKQVLRFTDISSWK